MFNAMFGSIFLAGFECATQIRDDGKRVDSIASTGHDRFCNQDYIQAVQHGFKTARDGFRWHLIGREPGKYDWSSVLPMLKAAERARINVIWDLCHYGIPEWLDIWSADFPREFAKYARAAVALIGEVSGQAPLICPVNELSFWAWIGGHEGKVYPFAQERAHELKRQLVRANLAGIAAARAVNPKARIFSAEPLIQIVRDTEDEEDIQAAAAYHNSQYEATDLMLGRLEPEIGGSYEALDILGVNYYPHNQWRIRGGFVPMGHHDYRPLAELLLELWERYRKPIYIAETGAEKSGRPAWLSYVCQEIRAALAMGVPIVGITIYPITDYLGWDNDRLCEVGLFGRANDKGVRPVCAPFWEELKRQQALFGEAHTQGLEASRQSVDQPHIHIDGHSVNATVQAEIT